MTRALVPILLCLSMAPATAQDVVPSAPPDMEQGFSLMEEGAKLLFKGLMSEIEPAMESMGQALTEMEPALTDLLEMIGDFRNYHAPEMLENGDIIIRRKTGLDLLPKGPEIEL